MYSDRGRCRPTCPSSGISNAAVASGAAERAGNGSLTSASRTLLAAPTRFSLTHPARSLAKISAAISHGPITSNQLRVLESAHQILIALSATQQQVLSSAPSSSAAKGIGRARGPDQGPNCLPRLRPNTKTRSASLATASDGSQSHGRQRMWSTDWFGRRRVLLRAILPRRRRRLGQLPLRRRKREGKDAAAPLTASDLEAQVEEIRQDKERLECSKEVDVKIAALEAVRNDLHRGLVGMLEEEDTLLALPPRQQDRSPPAWTSPNRTAPSCPPRSPPTARIRAWDLSTGEEVGRLRGHGNGPARTRADEMDSAVSQAVVKCLQVETALCGGGAAAAAARAVDVVVEGEDGVLVEAADPKDEFGSCASRVEGPSKEVTALHLDSSWLVTRASDKTLRQCRNGISTRDRPSLDSSSSILSPSASPRFSRSDNTHEYMSLPHSGRRIF
ncbi:hypothetical protein V8E36_004069 [Tilletia maclaganii]